MNQFKCPLEIQNFLLEAPLALAFPSAGKPAKLSEKSRSNCCSSRCLATTTSSFRVAAPFYIIAWHHWNPELKSFNHDGTLQYCHSLALNSTESRRFRHVGSEESESTDTLHKKIKRLFIFLGLKKGELKSKQPVGQLKSCWLSF